LNLAQKTVKGIIWAYTAFWGGRLLTLISTAILARILAPEDFGLIGFALLMISFIDAAHSFGINDALIYNSERVEDTADTAFLINLAIGISETVIIFLVAPLAVHFIDDPRVVDVMRIMGLSPLLNEIGNTHGAMLQKGLRFRQRFIPDLLSSLFKGATSIVLALFGFGVWSLVLGYVVGSGIQSAINWWLMPWRPRFRFYMDRARSLGGYGIHLLILNAFGIILDQADQLVIGTLLGAVQLGYYTIASKIPEMIIANFSLVLTKVLFPTYAKIKDDPPMLSKSFLTTTKFTAYITVPAGVGMAAVAPELVRVVFGYKWEPAIPLLQVLALLGTAFTLPWAAGDVYKAIGRPDLFTKLLLLETVYTFPLIYLLGIQSRLAVMASLANLISALISMFVRFGVITRLLPVHFREILLTLRSPILSGAVMFVAVTVWSKLAEDVLPDIVVLASAILVGAIVYLGLLYWMERKDLHQARNMILDILHRRSSASKEELGQESEPVPPSVSIETVDGVTPHS